MDEKITQTENKPSSIPPTKESEFTSIKNNKTKNQSHKTFMYFTIAIFVITTVYSISLKMKAQQMPPATTQPTSVPVNTQVEKENIPQNNNEDNSKNTSENNSYDPTPTLFYPPSTNNP